MSVLTRQSKPPNPTFHQVQTSQILKYNAQKFEKLGASHIPGNHELQWARNLLSNRPRGKTVRLSLREISQLYYVSSYTYSLNTKVVPRIA